MNEHMPNLRAYVEPTWNGFAWVVEEHNEEGEVAAIYGYPTESAAWAAYRMLTA
jgi:hypothetical protein